MPSDTQACKHSQLLYRISTPYHPGSLSSETRPSCSTISWQEKNLTCPQALLITYTDRQDFLFFPSLCVPNTVAAGKSFSFSVLLQNSSRVNMSSSATVEFSPWNTERKGEQNTIKFSLTSSISTLPLSNHQTPVRGAAILRCEANLSFSIQFCSCQPCQTSMKPLCFGHCPLLLHS